MSAVHPSRVLALSGGVGGAKLALGLLHALPPNALTVVVNTGDDFEHLGLHISPDVDTTLYTLADLENPATGWGRRNETWSFMRALEELGGETWFKLGDSDLALHVERTQALKAGKSLSEVTAAIAKRYAIAAQILPMSDDALRTCVTTDLGELAFQDYFVRHQCQPRVSALRFVGSESARLSDAVCAALRSPALEAIVICPSNPYLSIDPILSLQGMRARLQAAAAPIIAIAPLIGGQAVKGPTAKIMAELGIPATALEVARHYAGLLDGFVLDERDRSEADALSEALQCPVLVTNTLMKSLVDKQALARAVLNFAQEIPARPKGAI